MALLIVALIPACIKWSARENISLSGSHFVWYLAYLEMATSLTTKFITLSTYSCVHDLPKIHHSEYCTVSYYMS